jgi:phosphotriesterase-related protein
MATEYIVTVTGEVPGDQLGVTSAHEHLYCDISVSSGKKDNIFYDVSLIVRELKYFCEAGGQSIIELTPVGLGRDPAKLKVISKESGVQLISGIAFYDQNTYPDWLCRATADQIADYFVREIEEGTNGVRAGLIGELASHNEPNPNAPSYKLQELETLVFRAAARAQRRTGVAISTHACLGRAGHAQLEVLEQAGADIEKVVIGHCDAHWHQDPEKDMEYYLPILERGAYCGFDLIGWKEWMPGDIRAERIAALIELGYEKQLLLGTDTCRLSQLRENGGRGFDFLWTSFLPRLYKLGVAHSQIRTMLVEAPRRLLARSL